MEARWQSMMSMPIGDHRNIVVEVLGEEQQRAVAYWSGREWLKAPIADDAEPIDFKPMCWRAQRADAVPPHGEYAIVEVLGHRTLVGRTSEVERFGTKMLAIEPIWQDELLPEVLIGGTSIYAFTSCSAEVAFKRQAKRAYELPASLGATLPPSALPAPAAGAEWDVDEDPDGDRPFS